MFNANIYYTGFSSIANTTLGESKFYLVSYFYIDKYLYFIQNVPNTHKEEKLARKCMEEFITKYRKRSRVELKKAYSCKHENTHLILSKEFHSEYAELNYHFCFNCNSVDIRETIRDKEKHEAVVKLKFTKASLDETEKEIKKLKEDIEELEKEKRCHKQDIEKLEKILLL